MARREIDLTKLDYVKLTREDGSEELVPFCDYLNMSDEEADAKAELFTSEQAKRERLH